MSNLELFENIYDRFPQRRWMQTYDRNTFKESLKASGDLSDLYRFYVLEGQDHTNFLLLDILRQFGATNPISGSFVEDQKSVENLYFVCPREVFVSSGSTSFVTNFSVTGGALGVDPVVSITGGNDADVFEIRDGTGLYFKQIPDINTPIDSNTDNIYSVIMTAKSGTLTARVSVVINVVSSSTFAVPSWVSPLSITVVEERDEYFTLLEAFTPPGQSVVFRLKTELGDTNLFETDGSGYLKFKVPPLFAVPLDKNRDNVYEVHVRAVNGDKFTDVTLFVTVREKTQARLVSGLGSAFKDPDGGFFVGN